MNDLKVLILRIIKENKKINAEWQKSKNYKTLNMDKKLVCDLYNNSLLLLVIFSYRNLILENIENPSMLFNDMSLDSDISSRLKTINSIQFKIENYYKSR